MQYLYWIYTYGKQSWLLLLQPALLISCSQLFGQSVDSVSIPLTPEPSYQQMRYILAGFEGDSLSVIDPFLSKIYRIDYNFNKVIETPSPDDWDAIQSFGLSADGIVNLNGSLFPLHYKMVTDSKGKQYDSDVGNHARIFQETYHFGMQPFFDKKKQKLYTTVQRYNSRDHDKGFIAAIEVNDRSMKLDTIFARPEWGASPDFPPPASITTFGNNVLVQLMYEEKVRVYDNSDYEQLSDFGEIPAWMSDSLPDPQTGFSSEMYRRTLIESYTFAQIYNDTINHILIRVIKKPSPVQQLEDIVLTAGDSTLFDRYVLPDGIPLQMHVLAREVAAELRRGFFIQLYSYDFKLINQFESPLPFNLIGNVGRDYYCYGKYDAKEKRYWVYKWTWPEKWYLPDTND